MTVDPSLQAYINDVRALASQIEDHADNLETILDGAPGNNVSLFGYAGALRSIANGAYLGYAITGIEKQLQDYLDNL